MIRQVTMKELMRERMRGVRILRENGVLLMVNNKGNIEFWEII